MYTYIKPFFSVVEVYNLSNSQIAFIRLKATCIIMVIILSGREAAYIILIYQNKKNPSDLTVSVNKKEKHQISLTQSIRMRIIRYVSSP